MHVLAAYARRSTAIFLVVLAVDTSSLALSQSDVGEGSLVAFEHASVLPSHPAAGPIVTIDPSNGEFMARGVSLKYLVGYAYNVPPSRVVGGPGWVESAYYEVRAFPRGDFDVDDSLVTTDEVRPLVLGLLIDYFDLEAHIERAPLETVIIDHVGEQPAEEPGGRLFEAVPAP